MSKWDFLNDFKKSFEFDLKIKSDEAVLTNRDTGESIIVFEERYTSDNSYEYVVCFSTQHCHFDDIDDAAEYIRLILTDEVLPIEFYYNGKNRFGGEIRKSDFKKLSKEFLVSYSHHDEEYISQLEYEVHSWSGKYNVERRKVE